MGLTEIVGKVLQLLDIYSDGVNKLTKYTISDSDLSITDTEYYGFLNSKGGWYIMKVVKSSNIYSYRYLSGTSGITNYNTAWSSRTSNTYNTFNDSGIS